jgi:hypothetical protein
LNETAENSLNKDDLDAAFDCLKKAEQLLEVSNLQLVLII